MGGASRPFPLHGCVRKGMGRPTLRRSFVERWRASREWQPASGLRTRPTLLDVRLFPLPHPSPTSIASLGAGETRRGTRPAVTNTGRTSSLVVVYAVWLIGLLVLWPMCLGYGKLRLRYRRILRYF